MSMRNKLILLLAIMAALIARPAQQAFAASESWESPTVCATDPDWCRSDARGTITFDAPKRVTGAIVTWISTGHYQPWNESSSVTIDGIGKTSGKSGESKQISGDIVTNSVSITVSHNGVGSAPESDPWGSHMVKVTLIYGEPATPTQTSTNTPTVTATNTSTPTSTTEPGQPTNTPVPEVPTSTPSSTPTATAAPTNTPATACPDGSNGRDGYNGDGVLVTICHEIPQNIPEPEAKITGFCFLRDGASWAHFDVSIGESGNEVAKAKYVFSGGRIQVVTDGPLSPDEVREPLPVLEVAIPVSQTVRLDIVVMSYNDSKPFSSSEIAECPERNAPAPSPSIEPSVVPTVPGEVLPDPTTGVAGSYDVARPRPAPAQTPDMLFISVLLVFACLVVLGLKRLARR
jgi:hypothetical protein